MTPLQIRFHFSSCRSRQTEIIAPHVFINVLAWCSCAVMASGLRHTIVSYDRKVSIACVTEVINSENQRERLGEYGKEMKTWLRMK